MSEEKPIYQEELKLLISQALTSGELDISNRTVNFDFNLVNLLRASDKEKVLCKNKFFLDFTMDCPFSINANNTHFAQAFSASACDTGVIFTGTADFSHATFTGQADFINATFVENSNFSYSTFKGQASFGSASFSKKASFESTFFIGQASFVSTSFSGKADFNATSFSGQVSFGSAFFSEKASFESSSFSGKANFGSSSFTGQASFESTSFGGNTDFDNTTFTGQANFINTSFEEKADFSYSTFKGAVNFRNSTFSGEANFEGTTFKGWAYFCRTTFTKHSSFKEINIVDNITLNFDNVTTHDYFGIIPSVFSGEIIIKDPTLESDRRSLVLDFKDCYKNKGKAIFEGVEVDHGSTCLKVRNLKEDSNVKVHFEDCGFYGKNVAFTDVYMQQVSITGGNYVAGMSFYHCEWAKEPAFAGLEFRAFNGLDTTDVPKIVESYGNLKVSALDAGDAQLSNDFHFWHQWHQWENLYQKRLWNWNNFYRITSAYGMSVRLPLFWFLLTFLILWLPYNLLLMGHIISEKPLLVCCEALPYWSPLEGLFVSGSASIPFIFSDAELIKSLMPKDTTHWQTVAFYGLYILQHLIQGYLLFQIGAAIRNKVKR